MLSMVVDTVGRVLPILVFVFAITVVAQAATMIGVFEVTARKLEKLAHGRVLAAWLLTVGLSWAVTVVLSLDTTAVLLTPVIAAMCRRNRLAYRPFVLTCLWLANTGSLLLPVSNLTNLIVAHNFGSTGNYVRWMATPALASVAVTCLLLYIGFRASLRGTYVPGSGASLAERSTATTYDPVLLPLGCCVCLALGPAFVLVDTPAIPAVLAAIVLVAACWVRKRAYVYELHPPYTMVLVIALLFAAVTAGRVAGLDELLSRLVNPGQGLGALLGLAGVGAIGANLINNLPAFLALSGIAEHPARLAALLIGVNCGPLITMWGSLATLLWRDRLASEHIHVGARHIAAAGIGAVPLLVGVPVVALWLTL